MEDVRTAVQRGECGQVRLPITRTLFGADLGLTVHVLRGQHDGPTLGVQAVVHGDEAGSLPILRRFMAEIPLEHLRGTLLVVPVANPLALMSFERNGREQHGNTDLHTVFPGSRNGNLTQQIARTLTEHVLQVVEALVDMHSGGAGGRLQKRIDFDYRVDGATRERTIALCRAFGFELLHANQLDGTASYWLNQRGVPTVNVEVGGAYLGPGDIDELARHGVEGLKRVACALGMLEGEAPSAGRQLLFDRASRIEVNPSVGGFLESRFQSANDLAQRVEAGTVLGQVIDPYSLEVTEELIAPHTGRMFFSRYSGIVEAGTKAFGIAREDTSTWL